MNAAPSQEAAHALAEAQAAADHARLLREQATRLCSDVEDTYRINRPLLAQAPRTLQAMANTVQEIASLEESGRAAESERTMSNNE